MTARDGMADLILNLRGLTDAGTGDFTIGTISYFSDDHLQANLDRFRTDFIEDELYPVQQTLNGSAIYKEYRAHYTNLETVASGTTIFNLSDAVGSNVATTLWTADYTNGIVTFASDQGGTSYNLSGRSYDLNAAAGAVWRLKAANAAKMFDFSTDNHSLKRSQFMQSCIQMAEMDEGMASPTVVELYRGDMWGVND